MKVTIITVTYNSEKFLEDCIKSVLSQDYNNIEYIIVDGGSTDNTLKIIKDYTNKISHWMSESDDGIYDAINKGIKLSTGDIVGILNSDDFLNNNQVVSRIVEKFEANKEIDALYADVQFVTQENTNQVLRHYSSKKFRPWMFRFGFQPAHPTFYIKKSIFNTYGFYKTNLKIAGDFELLVRFLLIHKVNYKYVEDVWVKMRIGGISTSGLQSVYKVNNEILAACKTNNIYTNKVMIYSKYLIKWWGFIFK